jgi:formylmethanofuran dehydrogenase subunit C
MMMSALTLTLKHSLQFTLNCAPLNPTKLNGLKVSDIAKIKLIYGNKQVPALQMFEITGDDTQHIIFKNTSTMMDYLGANTNQGSVTIEGNTGDYCGYQLKNAIITINGNTGNFTACNMRSGTMTVNGHVGDFLGGASSGLKKGMRGGTIIVKGNAGDRTGDQMRRGLILIEGDVGDYCASRMIAGTIGVFGQLGDYTGFNMKRGTVLVQHLPNLHTTMVDCGEHTLPFLNIMFKSFKRLNTQFSSLETKRVQRYVGDAGNQGNGEILHLLPSS